jgi:DNA repair exonuclease SbcCD ATPase subunit
MWWTMMCLTFVRDVIRLLKNNCRREKKHNIEILNEKLDQQKALLDLAKDGQEKELAMLDNEYQRKINDIETKYSKETEFKTQLLQAESEAYERKKKEITDKYATEDLQKQEEIQLLTIELSSKYANQSEKTERQKQIAILETKIEFAEKALALLQVQGKEENSIEVLNARKTIQDLKKSLGEEIAKNDGQGFDIFEFLGLGDKFTSEQKTKMKQAFASIGQSLRQITDFVVQQYERQIEAKQKVIDQLDEEIGDLQDRLEEEKSLKEEGLANDVENIERQLAEKQRQKDEEMKQQEELVKKKKELQRIEMIADTAYQVVGLITASVDIFKSFAKLPFGIGIPLAIAVVGTMIGAFAAAKIKAFQAVSDGQKMQRGGTIRGKLHAQGGEKFYSASGENIELEEGEKVTNRLSSKKYENLLDAINADDFSRLPITDGGLRELFRKMGLTFQTDEIFKASKMNAGLKTIMFSKDTETLGKINEGIQYLVQEARDTPKSWEDDLFFYTKKGNKITKIPKKDEAEK